MKIFDSLLLYYTVTKEIVRFDSKHSSVSSIDVSVYFCGCRSRSLVTSLMNGERNNRRSSTVVRRK
jgi:hypothetical protein